MLAQRPRSSSTSTRAFRDVSIVCSSGPENRAYPLPFMIVAPSAFSDSLSPTFQLWPISWRVTTSNGPSSSEPDRAYA